MSAASLREHGGGPRALPQCPPHDEVMSRFGPQRVLDIDRDKPVTLDEGAARSAARRLRATAAFIEANPELTPTPAVQALLDAEVAVNPLGVNWEGH